ncbi:TPA: hypothetical protein QHD64_002664 [Staphylococcus aureus]|uniref:hypothetical protein n=1 Tax=Escherichia coli TaxID=562 RepID=UPI0007D9F1CE|nr:hypothetical protein [Escherichia coli]HEA4286197.1 hypothetical protein [Staphylococcus aureus]OAP71592.1 hypothetical protein A8A56_25710 [Escherichia coli]HAN7972527.1 hypothetical protein [Escherichia coli]HAN9058773.1 hypothetical protein [Escherichia coli]HAN9063537.1 hypothetical protein [Escherichia coli]
MGLIDDIAESIEEQGDLSEFKQAMKSELQTKVEDAKSKIKSIDDDIWDWQTTVNNKNSDIEEYCEGKTAERAMEQLTQYKQDIAGVRWTAEDAEKSCKVGSWFW